MARQPLQLTSARGSLPWGSLPWQHQERMPVVLMYHSVARTPTTRTR